MTRLYALVLAASLAVPAHAEPIEITARAIAVFSRYEPDRRDFGPLTFLGGLELSSSTGNFGGFSSVRLSEDGTRLTSATDRGYWFTARVESTEGKATGLADADLRPTVRPGKDMRLRTRDRDVEAIDIEGSTAWISMERSQRLHRLDLDANGRPMRATPVAVPKALSLLPDNEGVEAIVRLRAPHPYAGTLLMIAEEGPSESEDHPAWLVGGPQNLGTARPGDLSVVNRDGYAVTDIALLPNGDALLLERRYRAPFSLSMRIRRLAGEDVKPGARLDGPVLLEASLSSEIDNMEGIAVHQHDGRTIVTLMSDDNFSMLQRTLLLQFALKDE
jgi:hypothetical protein